MVDRAFIEAGVRRGNLEQSDYICSGPESDPSDTLNSGRVAWTKPPDNELWSERSLFPRTQKENTITRAGIRECRLRNLGKGGGQNGTAA
jgi:hypothetical protein